MSSNEEAEQFHEQIAELFAPRLNDLYALLGESPEAWRGAAMVARGMVALMVETTDFDISVVPMIAVVGWEIGHHPLAVEALRRMEEP